MEILLTSIIAFVSTNLDDIFILTLFFGDKKYKSTDIFFGQYLGISVLIIVSVIGSFVGNFIDGRYVGLLGLFPIYLGIRQMIALIRGKNRTRELEQKEATNSTGEYLAWRL